jgi:hypothetical protein
MRIHPRLLFACWLLVLPSLGVAQSAPPFATPHFLLPEDDSITDYRPVLNANGTVAIFERTFSASPNVTKLYSIDPTSLQVAKFVDVQSFRPDWCWLRAKNGLLSIGPVAFSNENGIYVVPAGGAVTPPLPTPLPNTAGMIYPSWYPDCLRVAADVTTVQTTAEIDATTGNTIRPSLGRSTVWAGFPSVNQVFPNLIAFAGQNNLQSNYYNQDINYIFVADALGPISIVLPFDRRAPNGPSFVPIFQARASWWSPDS